MKNGCAKFKTFPGAGSKEILHYVNPILESGNYDSDVLDFGVNDLLPKTLGKSDKVENLHKKSCRKMYVARSIKSFCVGDCAKSRITFRRS